jgi:putative oxidoreductase
MLNSPALNNLALLVGRIMLAAMFVLGGASKIGGYAATQGYMAAMGVPGAVLPLVIIVELIGGLLIVAGYQVKIASVLIGGFTLLAAVLFHSAADQVNQIMFMKNIAIAGGFAALFAAGPGAWSVEGLLGKK